jgi:hypothetical protein
MVEAHGRTVTVLKIMIIIKGKAYSKGEYRYSSPLSITSAQYGAGDQRHTPATLLREGDPVTIVREDGWVPGAVWTGAENLAHPNRDSIPGPPSPKRVDIPTALSRPPMIINTYSHIH